MFLSSLTSRIGGQGADGFKVSDRAATLAAAGADIISLTLGDPDFDTPEPIVEAAVRALRSGRTHYTPVAGNDDLREIIAQSQARVDGVAWKRQNVVVFPGAQSALFSAMLCVAEAGRSVVALDPLYATYEAVIGASGARLVRVHVDIHYGRNAPMRIDPVRLRSIIPDDACAILLNCPNNPGGFVLDDDTLRDIATICQERGLWLITDEVYRDLLFDGAYVSPSSLPGMADQVVVVNSLSKSHAMTGWRCGWTVAPQFLSEHLTRVAQCSLFGSPPFIQDAALEALRNADRYTTGYRDLFCRRRDAMLRMLLGNKVLRVNIPAGGMFALVEISASRLASEAFAERALEEAGVAVVPGIAFSDRGNSFIRISFARSEAELVEGIRRLKRFAEGFSPAG